MDQEARQTTLANSFFVTVRVVPVVLSRPWLSITSRYNMSQF